MLHSINIKNFKCFKDTTLETPALTVLTGFNASGKSTAMQALTLLHQDACEARNSHFLCLNGQMLQIGKSTDVLNKQHAKETFSITLDMDDGKNTFSFFHDTGTGRIAKHFITSGELLNALERDKLSRACQFLLRDSAYIGADRLGPQETYSLDYSPLYSSCGARGERTIKLLYEHAGFQVNSALCHHGVPSHLARQVRAHMAQLFPGFTMDIQPVDRTNFATLGLTVSDAIGFVRPQNIGFGLSSTLALITGGLLIGAHAMLMVENPEIHLHPRGQSYIGRFLASVASAKAQVMVETHSDHVINGIRKAVKHKILTPDDVAIYFFKDLSADGEPNIERISIKGDGSIDSWPDGFFDQHDKDLDELIGWGE